MKSCTDLLKLNTGYLFITNKHHIITLQSQIIIHNDQSVKQNDNDNDKYFIKHKCIQ